MASHSSELRCPLAAGSHSENEAILLAINSARTTARPEVCEFVRVLTNQKPMKACKHISRGSVEQVAKHKGARGALRTTYSLDNRL